MILAPILFAAGAACLLLVGPFGPCGPGTALGYIGILVGLPLFWIGWAFSLVAVVIAGVKHAPKIGRSAIEAAGVTVTVAIIALYATSDLSSLWSLGLWPLVTAAAAAIRQRTSAHLPRHTA